MIEWVPVDHDGCQWELMANGEYYGLLSKREYGPGFLVVGELKTRLVKTRLVKTMREAAEYLEECAR